MTRAGKDGTPGHAGVDRIRLSLACSRKDITPLGMPVGV